MQKNNSELESKVQSLQETCNRMRTDLSERNEPKQSAGGVEPDPATYAQKIMDLETTLGTAQEQLAAQVEQTRKANERLTELADSEAALQSSLDNALEEKEQVLQEAVEAVAQAKESETSVQAALDACSNEVQSLTARTKELEGGLKDAQAELHKSKQHEQALQDNVRHS